jgi:site-specific DNA-adenine methylase
MKTPIRYAGGKSKAIKIIGPLLENQKNYIKKLEEEIEFLKSKLDKKV